MMEKNLFLLLVFTVVVPLVLSKARHYILINELKTWSDAQAYCRANHANLATFETTDDIAQLQTEAQKQGLGSSGWIGLYNDINSWRWSYKNESLGSFTSWSAIEPSYQLEDCVALNPWCWFDVPCVVAYPFLCFDEQKTGADRFIYYSNSLPWSDAQSYCRQHHTDLASARNQTENTALIALIPGSPWNTWFGLFRDLWKWSDQTKLSSIWWMPGTLGQAKSDENCAFINNSQVEGRRCSDMKPFICYRPSRKILTLKLKVQSDQDMNVPAAKAAILEKISQEVKEHWMALNITVRWKDQPDGVVFHKMTENTTAVDNTTMLCEHVSFEL